MKSPLRVAIDLRMAAYRRGGIARYSLELSRALRKVDGVEPYVLLSRKDRSSPPGGCRVWTPPHHRLERLTLGLEALARRSRWSVFHATDFITPHLGGSPAVATVHDLNFLDSPEQLTNDSLGYYQQIVSSIKATHAWITPSEWTATRLSLAIGVPRERIVVAPHGVPVFLSNVVPLPRSERSDFLLAVGTIEPRKNYELLLDVLERTSGKINVVIVGSAGWQSGTTQERIKTHPHITWHQDVDDRTLRSLYRRALAVVVPSHDEGFGFSALEAMAAGTPVITSGNGALPEVTGGTQISIGVHDVDAWIDAIETVIEDTGLWSRLSNSGHQRSKQFTWHASAMMTLSAYQMAFESA